MKTKIAIKHAHGLCATPSSHDNKGLTASLNASLMVYGFTMDGDLFETVSSMSRSDITTLYIQSMAAVQELVGADVSYEPMYPNFPEQVMEASDIELYVNAMIHYWSLGTWKPDYETLPRLFEFEYTKFKQLKTLSDNDVMNVFTNIVSANDSISVSDKTIITWFLENYDTVPIPETIPFKENMCYVVGEMIMREHWELTKMIKTSTDVLRVVTYLSGGDISLAENTKFASLPRKIRRELVGTLEGVISEEDIGRHKNKWNKLFHNLHVGEYPAEKTNAIAKKVRSNIKLDSFAGAVQAHINTGNLDGAVTLLATRPGDFARRVDHLMRLSGPRSRYVVDQFVSVADKVSTRVLLQLLGSMQVRGEEVTKRTVFPKGSTARATIVRSVLPKLDANALVQLQAGIRIILVKRFSSLEKLGKVWIDPELAYSPLPAAQRSASEGLFQVARGTRLPIGDDSTLRFFIYWVGQDIDLSATMHDENFNMIERVAYTNLRSAKYQAYHSGDITSAYRGASEFIDINIASAINAQARYVAMNVLVYSGPTFAEHKKCYAGWMTRDKPNSNEIYDPKSVKQKIDLTADATNSVPVVFDLYTRKTIWTDISTPRHVHWGGNNVESNRANIEQTLEAVTNMDNKLNLYELFKLHATARGELVENKEDADIVFSMTEGITPYDISTINAEYLA